MGGSPRGCWASAIIGVSGYIVTLRQPYTDDFVGFVERLEPRLRSALCSGFGKQVGAEATVDALSYAFEHWDRIRVMENPDGYVWKVGRNRALRLKPRRAILFADVQLDAMPWIEPGLAGALASLSERQRTCVLLVHGFQWTLAEVAELLGIARSSAQRHTERAIKSLRRRLKVDK
jgi:DNA-directed RNA polymerase specialized sigma24 family protein